MSSEFFQWVFGEFIPWGDLVSDMALLVTLPGRDAARNSSLYHLMHWLLWVGTVISSIPEIALVVGICAGMVIAVTLGPATCSTGGKGKDVLLSNMEQTAIFSRYILSESKTITRFLLYFTHSLPQEWSSAVALAVHYMFFVPHLVVTYPFVKLWRMIKRRGGRIGDVPTSDVERAGDNQDLGEEGESKAGGGNRAGASQTLAEADGTSADHPWYTPFIVAQVVGGLMTEVSSIFFALSTGNVLSIVSAAFGLYCLSVSTLVAVLQGPKDTTESFAQRRQQIVATFGRGLSQSSDDDESHPSRKSSSERRECVTSLLVCAVFLFVVVGIGCLPFLGVYFLETGEQKNGQILAVVGCVLYGAAVVGSFFKPNFLPLTLGGVLLGFGVVYANVLGSSVWWVLVLLTAGSLGICSGCCILVNAA